MRFSITTACFALLLTACLNSSATAGVLGHDIIARPVVDSAQGNIVVDTSLAFTETGEITSWRIFADSGGATTSFQVWRTVSGSTFQLIGENIFATATTGEQTFAVAAPDRIQVQVGDLIGWRYEVGGGSIDLTTGAGDANALFFKTADVDVGSSTTFTNTLTRLYSIEATVAAVAVPEPCGGALAVLAGAGVAIRRRRCAR